MRTWNYIIQHTVLSLLFLNVVAAHAQSHYPGQHAGKFILDDKLKPVVYSFDLQQVRMLDGRFQDNTRREMQWILSLDANRLLHSFRTNAGLFSGREGGYDEGRKLAGWESLDCDLRGHAVGHILSGLALLYAATGEQRCKLKADSLVKGLAEVQEALQQQGFLSAWPQQLIDRNISGKSVWAPWYTQHKLLAGLIDQYLYSDNKQALEIATGMATWAYQKLKPLSQQQRALMLRNEFGGINETFYNLYAITGKPESKWLAEFFYHNDVLDPLKDKNDDLGTKHANTFIPKLLGLTRQYEIEGAGEGDAMAAFFWQTVVGKHSFCTGSNSDKEHFFNPDEQSKHLTGYTGETCNTYNMLKLTRHLFTHTGEMQYADYYERALFNHILGQQDPATGMVAYFLPLLSGAHKVYSTPDSSFWCCVGSGFESQAKFGEAIYYHGQNEVYVNLFIASQLNWQQKGILLTQQTRFPEEDKMLFTIEEAGSEPFVLNLRYPYWATAGVQVSINGKAVKVKQQPGSYIRLQRKWHKGDKVELTLPMSLHTEATRDDTTMQAILYGPIVLAGEMGVERAPYSNPRLHNDYYTYNYNIPADLKTKLSFNPKHVSQAIIPVPGKALTFQAKKEGITLRPLYDIHRQRYVVYWKVTQ